MSLEEIAEQQYRLEPERHARVEHAGAAGELEAALEDIEGRGGATDRVLTARTRTLHRQYRTAMETLFLAVDRADPVGIRRVDQDEVDPAEGRIKTLLHDAEDAQDAGSPGRRRPPRPGRAAGVRGDAAVLRRRAGHDRCVHARRDRLPAAAGAPGRGSLWYERGVTWTGG
ncbi:hypothetical protein [Dactylosporangium sp. NPDC049140]|uniref:hypothetical protein n=1 Tax=Dactylosporangium sp. NPDC049140 TaxID=3155647 RepID=UPI0033C11BDE